MMKRTLWHTISWRRYGLL